MMGAQPTARRADRRWALSGLGLALVALPISPLAAQSRATPRADWSQPIAAPSVVDPSIDCLATAISYEAGNEPIEGQEAVAQVVLNRRLDPAFPKSICGVIYQGSQRRSGCQFTFTCDGSLLRPRSARSLAAARIVAERVMRGEGSAMIGDALNYHADYVSPAWARSLERVTKIGGHIFYRRPAGQWLPSSQFAAAPLEPATGLKRNAVVAHATTPPGLFAPWGLPTLQIARSGRIKMLGTTVPSASVASQHQIGAIGNTGQRNDQLTPRMGMRADPGVDPDGERSINQGITVTDRP